MVDPCRYWDLLFCVGNEVKSIEFYFPACQRSLKEFSLHLTSAVSLSCR